MPTTTLTFETHATSLDNEAGLASGWYDADLSARGEDQARELGIRHRHPAPDIVYCSDLRRAWRTAEIAFGESRPIVRDRRLRECDYGRLTRARAAVVDGCRPDHIGVPFPGGESYEQVVLRVREVIEALARTRGGLRIVLVGHRATFYAIEHLVKGTPLRNVVIAPWSWQPGWTYEIGER